MIKTGIQWNFDDEILGGGFPEKHIVLLAGPEGIGKTIFGFEFLYNGAKFFEQGGLFISLDESEGRLKSNLVSIGWDDLARVNVWITSLSADTKFRRKKGKLEAVNIGITPDEIGNTIKEHIETMGINIKRVVIDPVQGMGLGKGKEIEAFRLCQYLRGIMDNYNIACCLLISQLTEEDYFWGIEQYAVDAVIKMQKKQLADDRFIRTIVVEKNRGTNAKIAEYEFEIRGKDSGVHRITGIINGNREKIYGIWVYNSSFGVLGGLEWYPK